MKRKIVWLVVSCLMVAALLLASCAPAAPAPEEKAPTPAAEEKEAPAAPAVEEEEVVAPPEKEMVRDSLGRLVEKPRYGGTFTRVETVPILHFDEFYRIHGSNPTLMFTNEQLMQGDWAKGPTGSGEASWLYIMMPAPDVLTGMLAESWEIVEPNTIIYHIRKGVYFHDKPPTNGREMTADDVAFTINRQWFVSKMSYQYTGYHDQIATITTPDKWTVVVEAAPGYLGNIYEIASTVTAIVPRDAVEQYGDLEDWRNSVGTGAFMLTDYVPGSSATLVRNPNYWMNDPLHPENQLPYLDSVKLLIIQDVSTGLAAMRTGKVDHLRWIGVEDFESLATTPGLKHVGWPYASPLTIKMRIDKPELPWADVRVRRALAMAIDNQEIKDEYYRGQAEILVWPIMPIPEFIDMYTPVEEQPEAIRELFEYHPDKAKQLLAEAGYPDGFKAEILSYGAVLTDMATLVKAYWEKIGVELEIDVKEYGVYTSLTRGHTHKEMVMSSVTSTYPFKFTPLKYGFIQNSSEVDDPKINEAWVAVFDVYFDEAGRRQLMREIVPYILEQVWYITLPAEYRYNVWHPWVKSYSGEYSVGYYGANRDWARFIWLDLDLKEEMTGKR